MLAYVAAYAIKLPKLSQTNLTMAAFDHYNTGLKDGQPSAQEIAKKFTVNGSRDQAGSNHRRQRDWIANRAVDFLRAQIASANPELTELAARTSSRQVREVVIGKIYNVIGAEYPYLAQVAAEARIRNSREFQY